MSALVEKFRKRRVQWLVKRSRLASWTIIEAARQSSRRVLDDLENTKYFPACHVEREQMRQLWTRFLRGQRSAGANPAGRPRLRNGLIISSPAGHGKSAWAAHAVRGLLGEATSEQTAGEKAAVEETAAGTRDIVLFLRGDMVGGRADCSLL